MLTFFGLNSSDRDIIYSEIHEIVFNGNGGYTWDQVYNMPVRLRKFVFNKLKFFYEAKNKERNALENPLSPVVPKIMKPNIITPSTPSPNTYSTSFSPKNK